MILHNLSFSSDEPLIRFMPTEKKRINYTQVWGLSNESNGIKHTKMETEERKRILPSNRYFIFIKGKF